MIKTIAIDDEPPALALIENYCKRHQGISLLKTFTLPSEGLGFIQNEQPDLVFLDIQMPSINGIELARMTGGKAMVIFTTAYEDFALEGFNLNAVDYLLKPFSYDRFCQALEKVEKLMPLQKIGKEQPPFITVRADYSFIKIDLHAISHIEGLDDYVKIHVQRSARPVVVRSTMRSMLEILPADKFVRVHRSYIVRIDAITTVKSSSLMLGEKAIPIGLKFNKRVREVFLSR